MRNSVPKIFSFFVSGLLDVPICSVNDNGFLSNPRYAPSFPPNSYANNKISRYNKLYNIPANSVNVNSQLHPINTITGLQYFLGKPMNMRIFRERIATRNTGGRLSRVSNEHKNARELSDLGDGIKIQGFGIWLSTDDPTLWLLCLCQPSSQSLLCLLLT